VVFDPVELVPADADPLIGGVLGVVVEALGFDVPVPSELDAAGAASHVPFTCTLWPTCAARSCVVSSCTPEGWSLSMTMYMLPICCRQPLSVALLPALSLVLLLVLLVVVLVVWLGVLLVVPIWSCVVLPVLFGVLPEGLVVEPLVSCAVMATAKSSSMVHVSSSLFTAESSLEN